MDEPTVGTLHPGSMGAAVAACAATNAAAIVWCEAGRSAASGERAARRPATRSPPGPTAS
ncbi:hypothetical protein [Streptomyces sp. ADI95-17]|uniref:hypothetical protein n=1 Tax=Streptomyces sp. ADI95-17 TaxID=1522759 RepID=UPI001F14B565|nr:hypothetical protein [Streptomyces sp. ADI95-17]